MPASPSPSPPPSPPPGEQPWPPSDAARVAFTRLARTHYRLLQHWLEQPHVSRWWAHETTPEAIESDFGACVDRRDPADVFIASVDGRPLGLIQRYTFADNPGYLDELAPLLAVPPAALSIDYFIGEASALRQGWGAGMIRACARSTWVAYPDAPAIVVPVNVANEASWRVLQAAGFRRVAEGPLRPDNPIDDWAHAVYWLDRPAACARLA
jgi:aminoglycoside 6'-N-acetyltransferase